MYAAANLADALSVTRRYLGEIGFVGWLKIALVLLFMGGFGSLWNVFNVFPETATVADATTDELWGILLVGALVLALVLAIVLAFAYLAALLEFVFVESLRSEAVHVRQYMRENLRHALWLLLFRIGLFLAAVAAVVALVVVVVVFGDFPEPSGMPDSYFFGILAFVALAAIAWWFVDLLTSAFVVPIMLLEDCGPISGWIQFARTIPSNPAGYLGFVAAAWTIGVTLWFLFAIIGFVVTFVGLILFVMLTIGLEMIAPSLVVVAFALLFVAYLCYAYVLSLLETPVRSYVRYYALLILGDTDGDLDLIPEQRAAVRADGGSSRRASDGRIEEERRPRNYGQETDSTARDEPTDHWTDEDENDRDGDHWTDTGDDDSSSDSDDWMTDASDDEKDGDDE
ncbi:DUF7544 domain-containing protein [Natronobacterium texcoconense]|uniref:Uncharacterized protein n=1 Tax=Natronobacterium texcoconense TaxID=1095778 RepID=A0A1H1A8B5_NATTX|nr:hypothetical protein [Natronobacterium texcoconense]SDQ35903.1 hypothetical protein SAMN04489842_0603 [Natronobacterium texcoconense]